MMKGIRDKRVRCSEPGDQGPGRWPGDRLTLNVLSKLFLRFWELRVHSKKQDLVLPRRNLLQRAPVT